MASADPVLSDDGRGRIRGEERRLNEYWSRPSVRVAVVLLLAVGLGLYVRKQLVNSENRTRPIRVADDCIDALGTAYFANIEMGGTERTSDPNFDPDDYLDTQAERIAFERLEQMDAEGKLTGNFAIEAGEEPLQWLNGVFYDLCYDASGASEIE